MSLKDYSTEQLYDLREEIENHIRLKLKESQKRVYKVFWLDGEILFKKYEDLVEWVDNTKDDPEIFCSLTITSTLIEESYYNKQPDVWDL